MVQVEIAQLAGECNAWRESLRQYREEFTQDKAKLQQAASQPLSKELLQEVEHLHNQFHIQLINIHDLKQAIKNHDRKMNFEMQANNGQLNDETVAEHESLFDQHQHLEQTLRDLRQEFNDFLGRSQ
jgi:ABC-type phosphate transport system auxiliary subunit